MTELHGQDFNDLSYCTHTLESVTLYNLLIFFIGTCSKSGLSGKHNLQGVSKKE